MDARIERSTETTTTLIVRANAFTKRIDDGYLLNGKTRVGALMTPAEVGAYIAANTKTKIELLYT